MYKRQTYSEQKIFGSRTRSGKTRKQKVFGKYSEPRNTRKEVRKKRWEDTRKQETLGRNSEVENTRKQQKKLAGNARINLLKDSLMNINTSEKRNLMLWSIRNINEF